MDYQPQPAEESVLLAVYYAQQQGLEVVTKYVGTATSAVEAQGYIRRVPTSFECEEFSYRFVLTDEGLKAVHIVFEQKEQPDE